MSSSNVTTIRRTDTRLVRVAVGRFAVGFPPVRIVAFVVPVTATDEQIKDRAFGIIRRELGIPGLALVGTVITATA